MTSIGLALSARRGLPDEAAARFARRRSMGPVAGPMDAYRAVRHLPGMMTAKAAWPVATMPSVAYAARRSRPSENVTGKNATSAATATGGGTSSGRRGHAAGLTAIATLRLPDDTLNLSRCGQRPVSPGSGDIGRHFRASLARSANIRRFPGRSRRRQRRCRRTHLLRHRLRKGHGPRAASLCCRPTRRLGPVQHVHRGDLRLAPEIGACGRVHRTADGGAHSKDQSELGALRPRRRPRTGLRPLDHDALL